jgi:large subunit ribosomal protein L22
MEATARLRHYRGSAQKVRLVADLIRRKPVGLALATLKNTRKACSADLLKLVESAIANAQQKETDVDALVVSQIMVDGAGRKPLQRNSMIRAVSNYKKRFARPRFMSGPQGRMWLVPRPFCHVTVVVSDDPEARKAAPKPVARRARTSRIGAAAAAVSAAGAKPVKPEGEAKPKKSEKSEKSQAKAKKPSDKAKE